MVLAVLGNLRPTQAKCGTDDCGRMRELTIKPPRSLVDKEAFGVLLEVGDLAEGDILTVYDVHCQIIGSAIGGSLAPGPRSLTIGLVRQVEPDGLVVRLAVQSRGEEKQRAPRPGEFRSLKLVPTPVSE